MSHWTGIIDRYRPYLALPEGVAPVSLAEGNTPLIPMARLAAELSAAQLFVKFDGVNPTASFKDRGMTTAITEAASRGVNAVICASTGNTAASGAAYAARAGIRCLVVLPQGAVATGKLAATAAHGAEVVQIEGSFDKALELVVELTGAGDTTIALVNSLNPFRLEGQKTAAFEICEELDTAPGWLALPVGNAGNITAYWMGFDQFGLGMPRLLGVQAAGAAPLVEGRSIEHPQTVASAIRIGRPARGEQALQAAADSGGAIVAVSDDAILQAQADLAREGLWVEPASAAGLAGLRAEVSSGRISLKGERVVCVCTGHGLKDPDQISLETRTIPADPEALRALIVQ